MKQTKKGFTLVELLVVIAILAVLATVSIVGYTTFIEKANRSVDEQAVAQMNTALMAANIPEGSITNIAQVQALLDECNLEIEDYKPLSKDTFFFYDTVLNRVIYTGNNNYNVLYPQDLAEKTNRANWFSLNGEIFEVTIDENPTNGWVKVDEVNNKVTVTISGDQAAEQLYTLSKNLNRYSDKEVVINIENDINMMGAMLSFSTDNVDKITIQGLKDNNPIEVTISNVANTEAALENSINNSESIARDYNGGLFPNITTNDVVVIKNITLSGAQIGRATTGNVGAFVGILNAGSLTMDNCHVENSTITGQKKVGGLIGYICSVTNLEIKNCTVKDTTIETLEGESGTAFGTVQLDPNSDAFDGYGLDDVNVVNSKVVYIGNSTSKDVSFTLEVFENVFYEYSMTSIDGIEFFAEKTDKAGGYRPFASDAKYFIQWYTTTKVNNETVNEAVVTFVK